MAIIAGYAGVGKSYFANKPLAEGEYLSDVKHHIDNIIRERTKEPVSSVELDKIETELFA